jgi:hypothetical protein
MIMMMSMHSLSHIHVFRVRHLITQSVAHNRRGETVRPLLRHRVDESVQFVHFDRFRIQHVRLDHLRFAQNNAS